MALSVVGLLTVHSILAARAGDLRGRSLLYALTIARDVPALIGTSGEPDLTPFANYVLFSGLLYAQVVSGDSVLLEMVQTEGAESVLRASRQGVRLPNVGMHRIPGLLVVDVAFPYGPIYSQDGAQPPYANGFVRLGIDASDLDRLAQRVIALAGAAGSVAWLLAAAGGAVILRRRSARKPHALPSVDPAIPLTGRTRVAGDLTLYFDESRLDAAGRSVDLTPKLRDILWLLFSRPGETFGDEEILAEVWRDSPYADSRDVKQHVYLIRKRLLAAGLPADKIVVNVPGSGYRIVGDPAERGLDPRFDALSIHDPPTGREDERT
jgi:DNA-binding winged helix-turn-helix (wHTH) protein